MKAWLQPPRSLLLILFLLTLASVSAVAWSGWNLLRQERLVEAQRAQERLEQTADQIDDTLKRTLAETGDRLGAWVAAPRPEEQPEEGVLLLLTDNGVTATPANRLLYQPSPSPQPEAPAELFAEGEALEFQQREPQKAVEWYGRLAGSGDAAVRAGALLRVSRVMRNSRRPEESRAAYQRLAAMAGVRVAGTPADLVARHALCELFHLADEAEVLKKELLRGRWNLTRGQFEYYWSEATRIAGREEAPPAEAVALSDAAAVVWEQRRRDANPRGQGTMWVDGAPFFVMWRGPAERRAVLVTRPAWLLKPITEDKEVSCAAADADGRILAGHRDGHGRAVVRTAAETDLPWTLYVTGNQGQTEAGLAARKRFVLLGTWVMVLFLISGTYFIGRAIRREMEVSRMQSDFVSAVSHEFRSPLTSMRQLSEILALGRIPNEGRRQVYYETLVRETARLQRLVEALLNFGRMEAGVRQYRFEEMEAAALVQHVVKEFESQPEGQGRHIEMQGAEAECRIEADPEALSVALRNLVDNALKYSPASSTVWVEWARERGQVAIRVRDEGAGIAAEERKRIFRKFVRGSAAEAANVKGSGVGLAMVRHIVAAHGGEIILVSKPGVGSTFTMLLPTMG